MIRDRNIDSLGISSTALRARQSYNILKPSVSSIYVVNVEDISGGDVAACTLVRPILDYPRNLLYTLTDAASDTLEGSFTTIGTDQFGNVVTETVAVDYDVAATGAGTQIFATITSVEFHDSANAAASDTASVGVAVTADVASFGLPDEIAATTDVININWIDAGVTKTQNIDATSIVIARNCFRPEQTVVAADDYVVTYKSTAEILNKTVE